MAQHNELGSWGEELAADYLRNKGYFVFEYDWNSGHRDIDLIAKDADVVVFVEVKTRGRRGWHRPAEAPALWPTGCEEPRPRCTD